MKISTNNHWDPLEEIIVGIADYARVPIRMRHSQTLSGGLHCTTLDLSRQGSLEDYR